MSDRDERGSARADGLEAADPEAASGAGHGGGITRRGVMAGGLGAAALALAGGFAAGHAVHALSSGDAADDGRVHYRSTALSAPALSAGQRSGTVAPGLLFLTPATPDAPMQGVICDDQGEPVWIEPSAEEMTDLRVQRYRGKNVLTYWTGKSVYGHGLGTCVILDDRYRTLAHVRAGNGLMADLHEFNITDRGTALITAYGTTQTDLSSVGGPKDGWVFEGHVQEIDVATGRVLLDWASLDHVAVDETYQGLGDDSGMNGQAPTGAFDYIHVNSADPDGDTLVISGRHTHAIYRVDRKTGEVLWRLGGRRSDFDIAPEAQFAWQHDLRHRGPGLISIFDNHLKYPAPGVYSRGLFLSLDEKAHTAGLAAEYTNKHLGTAMGNVQPLPGGNRMVGWGTSTYLTEFDRAGTPVFEMNTAGRSYRAYRAPWSATPAQPPQIAIDRARPGRMSVSISWNGATEVARWRVLTGASATGLKAAATVARSGFETVVPVAAARFARVEALDAHGRPLGRSATVKTDDPKVQAPVADQ